MSQVAINKEKAARAVQATILSIQSSRETEMAVYRKRRFWKRVFDFFLMLPHEELIKCHYVGQERTAKQILAAANATDSDILSLSLEEFRMISDKWPE